MKAKSVKAKSVKEIQKALIESTEDVFNRTLAIVFMSIKLDWKTVSELLNKKGVEIFGTTTQGEFTEEGIEDGNLDEVKDIANDLKQNLEKIKHLENLASINIKGMLEHSRISTGQKELTDINALADEYLRLSYHGLRAKGKSFNADFKTEFDETIPKINAIPQDIERVLLNLINNAFYAVDKRAREHPLPTKGGSEERGMEYKPTLVVSTASSKSPSGYLGVEIRVKDNGSGIPPEIKDKIFQPFFTTKPTGKGTGLGLSLSYDIVKAHGGKITVISKENKGTEFIIHLPLS
jgi:two-component system NtrC family sensor kinase